MTCIVGIEAEGRVVIAGDSAGSDGYSRTVRADEKVFTLRPRSTTTHPFAVEFGFGFTTSFRMGQALRYRFEPPAFSRNRSNPDVLASRLDRYMAVDFVDAVRICLKAAGFAKTDNGVESGGTFLVGALGRLYTVYDDYQVARAACGYAAVGSGAQVALGALHASQNQAVGPEWRIEAALTAAAEHTAFVAPPFVVVEAKGGTS